MGHRAVLHGCHVGNQVLVGMGAILLNGAEVSSGCIIGAGTLITEGVKIPERSLVLGAPGKVIRDVTEAEYKMIGNFAKKYACVKNEYIKAFGSKNL